MSGLEGVQGRCRGYRLREQAVWMPTGKNPAEVQRRGHVGRTGSSKGTKGSEGQAHGQPGGVLWDLAVRKYAEL